MSDKSDCYLKYKEGLLTFDEAFEGMTPQERYFILNAKKSELDNLEQTHQSLKNEIWRLWESIAKYQKEMEGHINRLAVARNSISRIVEDSKKNLEKYGYVLDAGIPKE